VKKLKIHLQGGERSTAMYTIATIRQLCIEYGVTLVENRADADVLWLSICDVDDVYKALVPAAKEANGRPIICGGFACYNPIPLLAWADAVVTGEGWEFIQTWGEKGMDAAMARPEVMTMERYKTNTRVEPSYKVPYAHAPLMRTAGGGQSYYYLGGRGCKGKCAFCATSWAMPYTKAPEALLERVVSHVEAIPKGLLSIVSNDADPVRQSKCISSQSIRITDYLDDPLRYKSRSLHAGIECWTEDSRRQMGKPISDDAIREVILRTAQQRQVIELFFIVGYPGWSMDDVRWWCDEVLPIQTEFSPFLSIKCTYLDPQPHTPSQNWPVDPAYWDSKETFRLMAGKNKRVKLLPARAASASAWRTAFNRCTPEEVIQLGKVPTWPNKPEAMERFRARLDKLGLRHLIGCGPFPHLDLTHTFYADKRRDKVWRLPDGTEWPTPETCARA